MRRISLMVSVLLLSLLLNVIPVVAEDIGTVEQPPIQSQQKDECLLVAKKCGTSATSIQDKIERLKEEIAKGTTIYTPEELNKLQQKLDEVNQTLDFLLDK